MIAEDNGMRDYREDDTNAKSDREQLLPRSGIPGAYFENDWTRFRVSCPRLHFALLALSIGIMPVIAIVRSFSISSPSAIRRFLPLTFSFDTSIRLDTTDTHQPSARKVFNLEILESEITIPSLKNVIYFSFISYDTSFKS